MEMELWDGMGSASSASGVDSGNMGMEETNGME